MKNLKLISLSLGLVCLALTGNAQSYAEGALLFSNTDPGGTARIQGLAGTQVSLGGDVSLASSNPAGLGMSNRSSITFSGALLTNSTESSFYNSFRDDGKLNFNIPQMGILIHKPSRSDGGYRGGTIAMNYTRTSSYHNRLTYSAEPDDSIIDYMLYDVDGSPLNSFQEGGYNYNSITGLGWFTYLIDTIGGFYDSYVIDLPSQQREEITTRGAQSQWNFSYGGNYDDKIFFGAGLGFTSFRYRSEKNFSEDFNSPDLLYIDLSEELFIRGTGINFTMGMIARPVSILQVGVSYTTPTISNVNDDWRAFITTGWNDFAYPNSNEVLGIIEEQTDLLISDYTLTSPSKFSAGATAFLGKLGFVTVDYETRDFSRARLRSSDFSMDIDNQEISNSFTRVNTLRGGAELRYEVFRFRAGAGLQTSAFAEEEFALNKLDRSVFTMSGGIGIRTQDFFADFALVRRSTESLYYPYILPGSDNEVITRISNVTGMVSVGFNF